MAKKKIKLEKDIMITGIADKGMAVGRTTEGEVVFLMGAVPGDVVNASVMKRRKNYLEGRIQEFVSYSSDRVEPFCKHFDDCGGCKWQNLDYEAQLSHKHKVVADAMKRIARLDIAVDPIMGAIETTYYRNKLEFSFSNQRWMTKDEIGTQDEIVSHNGLGYHIAGSFKKVLDIQECFLQEDSSNRIRNFIRDLATEHSLTYFDPVNHIGFLRNVIVRNSLEGDWMIILSVNNNDKKKINLICDALVSEFPFISSLYYVINDKKNDYILDLEFHLYHGRSFMVERLGDVKYKIGPKSFFQTNTVQAQRLFDLVRTFAGFKPTDNVYDLYTGLGSIALYIAAEVKSVVGIEEVAPAIDDARINADFNNIKNAIFYAGDVKDVLDPSFIEKHGKPDVVITDPPRAGMHAKVIETLLALRSPKIVYVSCNPATQARDLLLLNESYEVVRIMPVDMFPHTHHVECVVLLHLKESQF
jgi:23S rRNA (uracil1939-C5)-methyltransferase